MVKALIGGHGERYAFTHNVETLVDHAVRIGEQIPVSIDLIVALTDYACVWRYQEPDPITAAAKDELRADIARLREFTIGRLSILRPAVGWASV